MSDKQTQQYPNHLQGMRTYARDMEEVKNNPVKEVGSVEKSITPTSQKQTITQPTNVPKHAEQQKPISPVDNKIYTNVLTPKRLEDTAAHEEHPPILETKTTVEEIKPTNTLKETQTIPTNTREQVLARLHAKVSEHKKPTERLVEKGVLPKQTREVPELIELPNIQPQHKESVVSPIHTYKSDFRDYVHDTNASETQMLAKEQDSISNEKQKSPKNKNNIWFAVGGIIFLVLSISGLWYAYSYNSKLSAPVATKTTAPTLIFVDSQQELFGTGTELINSLARSASKPLANGSMRLTYISVATSTMFGATTTSPASGGYLIAALGLPMPEILMRNISLNSTVGIIHAGTQTRPFFVMRVASYDAAFAGMLRWEKTIGNDMNILYPKYRDMSSTTSATSTQFTIAPSFVDKIITNHDVRVLSDSEGRSILMYGFLNKKTLIIARNAPAFTEITNRLSNLNTQ